MREKTSFWLLFIGLVLYCQLPIAVSQSPVRERPKLKDFGKSLKDLKWDPKTGAATEKRSKSPKDSRAGDLDVVTIDTSLVVSDCLVVDQRGNAVTGLSQSDFIVHEEDELQEVNVFSLGNVVTRPRSIVLIIDYSGSQQPYLKTSIEAAKLLVDKLGPQDIMAIVTDDVELIQDFTTDKSKLKDKLDSLRRKAMPGAFNVNAGSWKVGKSRQYSALMAALKEAFNDEDTRPIIIFQTDGDEWPWLQNSNFAEFLPPPPNLSKKQAERFKELIKKVQQEADFVRNFSIEDVYRRAEQSRATIYTVISGLRFLGLSRDQMMERIRTGEALAQRHAATSGMLSSTRPVQSEMSDEEFQRRTEMILRVQSALAKVSALTGGLTSFLEKAEQADGIYSRILADINDRYIVGYYPKNKERDGKRRRVKIEVRDHPEYGVVGRTSYYAPGPN